MRVGDDTPDAVSDKQWQSLLHPLAKLHAVDPKSLRLPPLNPWRRIGPRIARLRQSRPPESDWHEKVTAIRKACEAALVSSIAASGDLPQRTVHGDYHLRQVLYDKEDQRIWLLDLDDLASGLPESDLGNFTAHLITSGLFSPRPSAALYFQVARRVQHAYETETKIALRKGLLDCYGAVALLRRALKCHERGDDVASVNAVLDTAADVSTRIGRQSGD